MFREQEASLEIPSPDTSRIVTADSIKVGDTIYVENRWYKDNQKPENCWRAVIDIRDAPSGSEEGIFMLVPEPSENDSRPLVKWVYPKTLLIVPK